VTTVVAKLFNLVRPTRAYFGQKDAQQAVVIQRMVIDLNFPIEIVVCPIVRETDGLAMSSRNRNIPPEYRQRALVLRQALQLGRELIQGGETNPAALSNAMGEHILQDDEIELDYPEIVSPETLEAVEKLDDLVLIAGAIKIGGVRLIDNILVGPSGPWED
jgi:pantoate--beta-alanine ligase